MASENKVEPRTVKGFRDLAPVLAEGKYQIIDHLRGQARAAGFASIMTPAVEFAEVLLGSGGQETDKEVYKFSDHGGRDLALRYDLTVPFARFVAANQGTLVFPFKKFQVDEVWRGEKPQKGRYRQFCQADFDVVGVDSMAADVEVMVLLHAAVQHFVGDRFTMSINHRVLLNALIKHFFKDATATQCTQVLIAIDKLAKVGVDAVAALINGIFPGCAASAKELLQMLTAKDGNGDTDLANLESIAAGDASLRACIDRLRQSLRICRQLRGERGRFKLDLSVARGLGYYTGVVFETFIDDLPGFGSVSSGGRYDTLVERFINRSLPGVGGSIGVDRLLAALEELGKLPQRQPGGLMVAVATEDAYAYAFEILQRLRAGGYVADIGMTSGKVGNQFKYADRSGYSHVITVGSDEMTKQCFSLKDMRAGTEQRDIALARLLEVVPPVRTSL